MLTRRHFLTLASRGVGLAIVSHGIMGCSTDSSSTSPQARNTVPNVPVTFEHGVASGDPTQDAVILWTRVSPINANLSDKLLVAWEVATDSSFNHLITNGETLIGSDTDYTIKIDAVGLKSETTYYYRFLSGGKQSEVGKTKTLSSGPLDSVKLAVFSCANYPAGFFNAYELASQQDDLDAVIHLGDYIYEYGRGGYAAENAEQLGREVLPVGETITLSDYRTRYAQYRGDEGLQKLHQRAPFICVWDDHEICNDTYLGGAENHNENEGNFEERKLAALQAYFEWMPIRPVVEDNNEIINRAFKFGNLVDLFMLDTRVVGRDKQLEYANYIDSTTGQFDAERFKKDVSDENRTLLGEEQLNWLKAGLRSSTGMWQVLGQQVLMGRMLFPAAIVNRKLSTAEYAELAQLARLGQRIEANDTSLKPDEVTFFKANRARLTDEVLALLQLPNIPYNLDAWDGYAAEREVILETAKQLGKNTVVLAGDTHNAWANDVKDYTGDVVAVEFATPSVSSPGLESYLNLSKEDVASTEVGIVRLIEGLQYMNASDRGFLSVTFTPEKVTSTWHFVDTILSRTYSELTERAQAAESVAGAPGIKLI